jgi:hypothetical protein
MNGADLIHVFSVYKDLLNRSKAKARYIPSSYRNFKETIAGRRIYFVRFYPTLPLVRDLAGSF